MHTSVDRRGNVATVHIAGSVDGLTSEGLQQVFAGELAAQQHNLVADFSAVATVGAFGGASGSNPEHPPFSRSRLPRQKTATRRSSWPAGSATRVRWTVCSTMLCRRRGRNSAS